MLQNTGLKQGKVCFISGKHVVRELVALPSTALDFPCESREAAPGRLLVWRGEEKAREKGCILLGGAHWETHTLRFH